MTLALLSVALLPACSSRPESSDIEKQLTANLSCAPLVIKDVKKTNGASAEKGLYAVAYTFNVEMAGGKEGAVNYLKPWLSLTEQVKASEKAFWATERQSSHMVYSGAITSDDASKMRDQASSRTDKLRQELDKLGACDNMLSLTWLSYFHGEVFENAKAGKYTMQIPLSLQLSGTGVMQKSEAGWVFVQFAPAVKGELILGEQVKFDQPIPPPTAAASVAPPTVQPSTGTTCLDNKIAENRNSKGFQDFVKESGVEPTVQREVFESWQEECGVTPG
jgi:hypothetical protein